MICTVKSATQINMSSLGIRPSVASAMLYCLSYRNIMQRIPAAFYITLCFVLECMSYCKRNAHCILSIAARATISVNFRLLLFV